MGFHEVLMPPEISYGSSGGPGHNTAIIETDSGQEERPARWAAARRRFNLLEKVKSPAQIATIIDFVIARRGSADGFRLKDWIDFTTAPDHISAPTPIDMWIGVGDGVTTTFQLIKAYTSLVTRTRTIEKPVAGTVRIAFDGAEQLSGWTVNTATGVVTFSTPPGDKVQVTAGFQFDVPVRFDKSVDEMLDVTIETYDSRSIDSMPCVELKSEAPIDEEFWHGDANVIGAVTADVAIAASQGRVVAVNPTTGGLKITLPDYASVQAGGPHFLIQNLNNTNTIELRDHLANLIITIGTLAAVTVVLALDAGGGKVWYAF